MPAGRVCLAAAAKTIPRLRFIRFEACWTGYQRRMPRSGRLFLAASNRRKRECKLAAYCLNSVSIPVIPYVVLKRSHRSTSNHPNWQSLICRNQFNNRCWVHGETVVVGGLGLTERAQSRAQPDHEDDNRQQTAFRIEFHRGFSPYCIDAGPTLACPLLPVWRWAFSLAERFCGVSASGQLRPDPAPHGQLEPHHTKNQRTLGLIIGVTGFRQLFDSSPFLLSSETKA